MKKDTLKKLETMKKNETILWGDITKLGRKGSEDYMEGSIPKSAGLSEPVQVIIMDSEADTDESHGSLVRFLARSVPFVVVRVDEDIVYGSRRLAQEAIKASMLQQLNDGVEFTGQIVGMAPYGAYVEVNGVSGLLRNNDATSDHSELREYHKVGDTVRVVCRSLDTAGRINWTTKEKLHRKAPVELPFEVDTVVPAVVTSITTFKGSAGVGVFARVATGVDALCSMPEFEVFPGQRVAVKVLRITPDSKDPLATPKVRGKIVRTL